MESIAPQDTAKQVAALLQRRRTDLARQLLQPALARHPDNADLLLQSAWTDYLDDKNESALSAVRQVLAGEPSNENARVLYFELLMEDERQLQEAERVIIELLREYPEASDYYGRYANLMLRTLNVAKAMQLAREGLKYNHDDAQCLVAQATCELIERPGAASHALQRLLVGRPKFIRTLLLVVVALEQRGDVRGARRVSQELVRAQPDNEHLVELARVLNVNAHWSMLPLWPMQKWGWGASFGIWLFSIVVARALSKTNPAAAAVFVGVMLTYVVYSWVWPPLLRRLLK